jgi:hypothetical protein
VIAVVGNFGALFVAQPFGVAHVRMAVDLGPVPKYTSLWSFFSSVSVEQQQQLMIEIT